ncbi:hypothetical protein ASD44_13220 [Mesorhizobium sp. Root554]|uniref:hypothetical protein n=1 Tax=unclassified Mesorhizobium TaxID=325217 RepID=UPI0006F757E1|nr:MULTISPECIES: hypothetical protein [unclassified Mesorhizobium]KQZ14913.1 hypothetical protein ASD27_13225 [Mesorhizobium sp. Root1471]KQZ37422.1 hypothetical protein ASD44_13220 [Mesorhizobium sp. Root554]
MADFVAVLRKTLDGLGETTPEVRAKVYDKARSTIAGKLAALDPPPAPAVADRQRRALEDAISTIERDYTRKAPELDPLAELENIFSSIDRNRNQPNHVRPAAKVEPAWQRPQPEARPPEQVQKPAVPPQMPPLPPLAGSTYNRASPPPTPIAPAKSAASAGPAIEKKPVAENRPPLFIPDEDADTFDQLDSYERKRGYGGLIAAAIALLVVAGGGYGIWLNQDAFKSMLGIGQSEVASNKPIEATPATPAPQKPGAPTQPPAPAGDAASGEAPKFTQRLQPDGKETDPGPAGGESGVGEGTSVVALTTPPPAIAPGAPAASTPGPAAPASESGTAPAAGTPPTNPATPPAAPANPSAEQALAVGQKAIFYEERTSVAQGSAEPGNIVWSIVQESPGGDAPPEPAIRAEATIPGKDIQLRMTIRRNADQTLPASHIIEMIFLTPDGIEGGGIDNVLRVAMKASEQEAGSPLIGIPAKIADGFFLVALNDTKAEEDTNLALLRNQDWIDIPVVYKSGRRALLTVEKGIPGDKVFDEAMQAWQAKAATAAPASGG